MQRLLIAAVLLAGCAKTGIDTTPLAVATTNAPLPPTRPPTATANPDAAFRAKVGTAATYSDGWKVTVTKWEEQGGGILATPKPGTRFVAVTVRYDNGTPKEGSFNAFDWNLQDSAGVRHTVSIFAGDRTDTLNSGNLAPGGFVTGTVQFEVPVGDVKLEMLYTSFAYKLATWELY
jgi:Domain of unknown function (DUF4352)